MSKHQNTELKQQRAGQKIVYFLSLRLEVHGENSPYLLLIERISLFYSILLRPLRRIRSDWNNEDFKHLFHKE